MRTATAAAIVLALTACGASTTEPGGTNGQPPLGVGTPVGNSGSSAPPAVVPQAGTGAGPAAPAAGSASTPPVDNPPMMPGDDPPPTDEPRTPDEPTLALDECNLDTRFPGDEYCILPPPENEGFQLRVGPPSYDNPGDYVVRPGQELNEVFQATSGNTEDVYYYWRQYRMRPGSHHMILSKGGGLGGGGGRIGGSQTPAKDSPTGGVIAPENAGVGMQMAARTPLSFSLHYFNYTDGDIVKDVWVNVWYRDEADVTEPATEVFSLLPVNIAPGRHVVLSGDCSISGTGRLLTLYGHRHANNVRFSAWRERGSMRDLVFEDYHWEEPTVLEYSSVITNEPPNQTAKIAGGYSGVLDVSAGDNIHFECEIVNMTTNTFRGANEAIDDEMCILVGDSVGARVTPLCQSQTVDVN